MKWYFSLFGSLSVTIDGKLVELPPSRKARDLLAYLAYTYPTPQPKSRVLGLFWGDSDEKRAKRALAQTLWRLRQTLPEESIHADRHHIVLTQEVEQIVVDAHLFKQQLASMETHPSTLSLEPLQQTLAFYTAPLLDDVYMDWVEASRAELLRHYIWGMEQLAGLAKQNGRLPDALNTIKTLLTIDDLNESWHQELMRLHIAMDNPHLALAHYDELVSLLDNELGVDPQPETVAVAKALQGEPTAVYTPDVRPFKEAIALTHKQATLPLIGRLGERQQLVTAVSELIDGYGGVALIAGEVGVGKTRLLEEVAQDAEWQHVQVMWGYYQEASHAQAYDGLLQGIISGLTPLRVKQLSRLLQPISLQVLTTISPILKEWLPNQTSPPFLPPEQETERIQQTFADLIITWAKITPLLFIIEDIQWADFEIFALLERLTQRLRHEKVLILLSQRNHVHTQQRGVIERLIRLPLRQKVRLQRLSKKETADFVRQILGLTSPSPLFIQKLHNETQGNSLFILEILRVLYEEGTLTQTENGHWHTPFDDVEAHSTHETQTLAISNVIEDTIQKRISYLEPTYKQILQVASVLGHNVPVEWLLHLLDIDDLHLFEYLHHLTQWEFLTEQESYFIFYHDLMRQVVYDNLTTETRLSLHQQILTLLEEQVPDDLYQLSWHARQGQIWDKALHYTWQLAQKNRADFAFKNCIYHCTQALAILDEYQHHSQAQQRLHFDILYLRSTVLFIIDDAQSLEKDQQHLQHIAQQLNQPAYMNKAKYTEIMWLTKQYHNEQIIEVANWFESHAPEKMGYIQAQVAAFHAKAHIRIGNYEEAIKWYEISVSRWSILLQTSQSDSDEEAIWPEIANAYYQLDRLYDRTRQPQKRIDLLHKLEVNSIHFLNYPLAQLWYCMISSAHADQDAQKAIEMAKTALSLVKSLGYHLNLCLSLVNLAICYDEHNQHSESLHYMIEALDVAHNSHGSQKRQEIAIVSNIIKGLCQLGCFEEAQQYETRALALLTDDVEPYWPITLLTNLSEIYLHSKNKNLEQAERYINQVITSGYETLENVPSTKVNAYIILGDLHKAKNDTHTAIHSYQVALETSRVHKLREYRVQTSAQLALLYLQLNESSLADKLSEEAISHLINPFGFEALFAYHARYTVCLATQQPDSHLYLEKAYQTCQKHLNQLKQTNRQNSFIQLPVVAEIFEAYENQKLATAKES